VPFRAADQGDLVVTDTLLCLEQVSRSFRLGDSEIRALDRVDLGIARGEVVVVTGPSGSGKSTLLHLAGGLDRPDSGTVTFDGTDLASLKREAAARFRRRHLGFVFQFFNLVPALSAVENVSLPLLLDGVAPAEADRRAAELLDHIGLGDRCHQRAAQLSGGQLQRVSIARALITAPALLLADEPTGNLDSATGQQVMDELRAATSAAGTAVLLITHDRSLLRDGDRALQLRDGNLGGAGAADSVGVPSSA
jgi:ABC-type lipoprotein export system ATPase subunit